MIVNLKNVREVGSKDRCTTSTLPRFKNNIAKRFRQLKKKNSVCMRQSQNHCWMTLIRVSPGLMRETQKFFWEIRNARLSRKSLCIIPPCLWFKRAKLGYLQTQLVTYLLNAKYTDCAVHFFMWSNRKVLNLRCTRVANMVVECSENVWRMSWDRMPTMLGLGMLAYQCKQGYQVPIHTKHGGAQQLKQLHWEYLQLALILLMMLSPCVRDLCTTVIAVFLLLKRKQKQQYTKTACTSLAWWQTPKTRSAIWLPIANNS